MNDPRITQYALGELDSVEREAFERELAASELLQAELKEITDLTTLLKLHPINTDTLTETQRDTLKSTCHKNLKVSQFQARRSRIVAVLALGALAACLLLAPFSPLTLYFGEKEVVSSSDPTASSSPPPAASPGILTEALLARELTDLVKQGEDFFAAGRYDLASKRFSQALVQSPDYQPAQEGLLKIELSRKQFADTQNIPLQTFASVGWEQPVRSKDNVALPLTPNDGFVQYGAPITAGPPQSMPMLASSGLAADPGSGATLSGSVVTSPVPPSVAEQPARSANASSPARDKAGLDSDIPLLGRLYQTGSRRDAGGFNTEAYDAIRENEFLSAKENPLSTFSIDVDTASYANVRRFLQNGQFPPAGAVRTEELINYFPYAYPLPKAGQPFSVNMETSQAPWAPERVLVRIGLKGMEMAEADRAPANLVFLIDVSGSMNEPDKLPLLKQSLQKLVENLAGRDHVAIVTYAGSSGLVLPSTPGTEKARILAALENLQAGGSTNGASGITLAYQTAREHFLKEGNNRVILCTDGDFNVGTTNQSELTKLIEQERASGVFLSVLGFGTGNLKDSTMEKLADKGNGNYAYIDSPSEGRKVLVDQMGATLFTIAKDVKIQVEFNPAQVSAYRLIGYENRLLAKEDFRDDTKDAGEIGAGHSVTALYEVIPTGQAVPGSPETDPLKYQKPEPPVTGSPVSGELLTVKLRYKKPDGDTSKLIEVPLTAPDIAPFESASPDFQFAAAVSAFGMKLRASPTSGDLSWADIQRIVRRNLGEDEGSYRAEFLTLLEKASRLKP